MLSFRLTISTAQRKELERKLKSAQQLGDVRLVKWILALFAVVHDQSTAHAARVLDLSGAQVERYIFQFLCYGVRSVGFKKPSVRRPKLTKEQQRELADLIDAGPQACGFSGACWRETSDPAVDERAFRCRLQCLLHRAVTQEPRLQFSESGVCFGSS